MDSIMDHKKDHKAVSKNGEFVIENGKQQRKKTTDGLYFNIQWKDGTTSWEPLKLLKGSNPIEVAEYTVANKIES
jgi:hypothetical protein